MRKHKLTQMFFFQFSKNGRRDKITCKRKRNWAKPNDSTMNRVCRAFDDIGNINMNLAGVPPFNWQMLMPGPCTSTRPEIVNEFISLSSLKLSLAINETEESPNENESFSRNGIMEEHIVYMLENKFGSLETCYPYIVKHLFTGENASKSFHKQTFWRVFGDIALKYLRKNLDNCITCRACKMKVPAWVEHHVCPKNEPGFFECVSCQKIYERLNSRQCRCKECQEHYRHDMKLQNAKKKLEERKERSKQLTAFLLSHSTKMY